MRVIGPDLILATSDLTKYVRCGFATHLDHVAQSGAPDPPARRPPSRMTALITQKGNAHERTYVDRLRAEGKTVVEIERAPWSLDALRRGERETLDAMQRGSDFIYQAAFFDGRWSGYADLLQRVERPSPALGTHSYEVVDTKLARAVRPHFILQLSDYSQHLARLQGIVPELMHVVLGKGEPASFRVADFAAHYRHVRRSLDQFVGGPDTPSPYPVDFCALCDWSAHCWKQWNDADHLSLVANIRRTQVTRLERVKVNTLTILAETPRKPDECKIADETFATLNHQASMQLERRRTGEHRYELLPRVKGRGFSLLPRRSGGDVFLDFEGDPFAGDGLTYLFGAAWEENGEAKYTEWWAHDAGEEKAAFEAVMDFITSRRATHPEAFVYHYGAAEPSTLKRLMSRYATRENELDDLLRREAFVDLSSVVRQGMRISHSSYGLKKVETFYFDRTSDRVADAGGAVLAYEEWLETSDDAMLEAIRDYNREDCLSIVAMRQWLLAIRPDDVEWRELQTPPEQSDDKIAEEQKKDALYQELLQREMPLLAHLLYYHRREERPTWWAYHARRQMGTQEWIEDSECIGALQRADEIPPRPEKKSKVFTYRFPGQEHKFEPGKPALDPLTEKSAGTLVAIDDGSGTLALKRGPTLFDKPDPVALMPDGPINSTAIRTALQRFAQSVLTTGIDATPYRAAAAIMLRERPRVTGDAALSDVGDAARRLDRSYLFVQGPPGSGKTFTGAAAVVQLLRSGKRVGITSNSHRAIHNMLDRIEELAHRDGFWFRGVKKSGDSSDTQFTSKLSNAMIESCDKNADCADRATPLVAGTAWLFSDPALEQSLDFLFIDEAGQIPLANAVAMATAARNVVLLGDPLQLAQVSQGSHPDGAGVSVLQHLLGDHVTVPRDRGIFLEESWRMHGDVCRFVSDVVYESRLRSKDECSNQAVTIDAIREAGLRFMPVQHEGNSQSSDEEAERVAAEVRRMISGTFTNAKCMTAKLQQSDFLVVAAYNAQVRHLKHALAAAGLPDVPVGTVDKFQGREAPVVFFSMATSTGAELPRGVEFLFSLNRLNVAISRARCLAIIVASPKLLDVACATPEQMKLVNALCRYVEMAKRI